jgi:hypothetical protein
MEEYVTIHQKSVVALIELQKLNVMEIPEIEAKLPNSFI